MQPPVPAGRRNWSIDGRPPPKFSGRRRRSRSWPCPHPAEFAILVVHELHDITVQLSGALTRTSVDALHGCITAALADAPRRLVFELSGLERVDDDSLECFLAARDAAGSSGVTVVVDSPNRVVRHLLEAGCGTGAFAMR